MSRPWRRPDWLRSQLVDLAIALALLVEMEIEIFLGAAVPDRHRLAASLVVVLFAAPVAVRRRWPGPALVALGLVTGAVQLPVADSAVSGLTGTFFPLPILAFTAGAQLNLRRGVLATAATSVLIASGTVWSVGNQPAGYTVAGDLFSSIGYPFAFWALGWMWQHRRRRAAAFHDLVTEIETERARSALAAAETERIRIGREVQDIIAQNVSAIIIQAGGARQLIGVDTYAAVEAIHSVERAGREALADLRRTLGLLRSDDDPRSLAPQPGLAQLDSLLSAAQERGTGCELRTDGSPRPVSTGIDLLAYRFVEATLRTDDADLHPHTVAIAYHPDGLQIQVSGGGPAAALAEHLQGVRDRVSLYDGSVSVEPADGDGFVARVHLPLGVTSR